jgi:hypothetical protein
MISCWIVTDQHCPEILVLFKQPLEDPQQIVGLHDVDGLIASASSPSPKLPAA